MGSINDIQSGISEVIAMKSTPRVYHFVKFCLSFRVPLYKNVGIQAVIFCCNYSYTESLSYSLGNTYTNTVNSILTFLLKR